MQSNPYLNFNGDCAAAFKFYEQCDDVAEAERIFHALAKNGTVKMPIQETFWAKCFGMLIDRFGIPWMINCDFPA